jgi:hypothetical protein
MDALMILAGRGLGVVVRLPEKRYGTDDADRRQVTDW